MKEKIKVLVLVGPTAVGKTALSIELAKAFDGEIISGDSLQVYRGLDIGTAKVTETEMAGIPHYLIDEKDMTDTFSAADFQESGRALIEEITNRGKLPIVVGGTGLYIQALLYDFKLGGTKDLTEDLTLRRESEEYYQQYGATLLWEKLRAVDPVAAEKIHPNNVKRVIRAIEVKSKTGKSIFEQGTDLAEVLNNPLYDVQLIGLTTDRDVLYERINQRVDLMMQAGLLEEARQVYHVKEIQAAQGIGYKEFFPYFAEQAPLELSVEQVKQNSRRYAKRQLTWFRNRMTVDWWDLVATPESETALKIKIEEWLKPLSE